MLESLSVQIEKDQIRREDAFNATRKLFENEDSQIALRKGLELHCGKDDTKISSEMNGFETFLEEGTTMSFFNTNRGLPFRVWGMITEQMKSNPELTSSQFEDETFLKEYLKDLPKNISNAYTSSASTST